MNNDSFIEASAYLRVLEKRLLTNDGMNRVADAAGTLETLKQLTQNSGYDFSALSKPEDYEFVLKDDLINTYAMLYKLSERREVVDVAAAKYDFHNLKVALKAKYLNLDMRHLYFTVTGLSVQDIEAFAQKGDKKENLPEYAVNAILEAQGAFEDGGDPQMIDIIMDRHMFSYMLSLCKALENDFITKYVRLSIDFYNIKTLMRVKGMKKGTRFLAECLVEGGLTDGDSFIRNYDKPPESIGQAFAYKHFGGLVEKGLEDYGRTKNFSGLEKHLDNCLIEYVKNAKYLSYGEEVLFAYIVSKENEIRQIRILVTGKINGLRFEALKERLRDNYG